MLKRSGIFIIISISWSSLCENNYTTLWKKKEAKKRKRCYLYKPWREFFNKTDRKTSTCSTSYAYAQCFLQLRHTCNSIQGIILHKRQQISFRAQILIHYEPWHTCIWKQHYYSSFYIYYSELWEYLCSFFINNEPKGYIFYP